MKIAIIIGVIVAGIIGSIVIFSSISQDMWKDHRTETIGSAPDEIDEKIDCLSKGGTWQYTSCSFEKPSQVEPAIYGTCSGAEKCITEKVIKIVDGDTIYTESYKIRLSLTNTPEKDELGFTKATSFTAMHCPIGSTIRIDQDDLQPYDVYGRLLGKVYCGNDILNEIILRNGHGTISTEYCTTSEFSGETWALQYGCKNSVVSSTNSISVKTSESVQSSTSSSSENNCEPSYPDVCIPHYPPDLDCSEISYSNFRVLSPDPHGFDRNNDGIGCES